jgi:membrane-associated phospholipid phosphatase
MAQAIPKTVLNRPTVREAVWLTFTAVIGQLGLAAISAALAIVLFAVLADVVAEGATRQFDLSVVHYFHVHQPAWMRVPLLDITWLANGPTIAAVLGLSIFLLILLKRIWPDAGTLLLSGLGGYGFVELVKFTYHRPRPSYAVDTGYSFPSGHSFLSTAIYGMLAYYLSLNMERRAQRFVWTLAVLTILLIGSSRVLLGAHYPSDVLAGFASGGAWLWCCLSLRRLFRKRDWASWRGERLSRLAASRGLLEELALQRAEIEGFGRTLLLANDVNLSSRLLARLGFLSEGVYQRLAHPGRLARRPYDLVALGYFLRAATKRLSPEARAPRQQDLKRMELPLRQLWTAQRGLFGRSSDEVYEPVGD